MNLHERVRALEAVTRGTGVDEHDPFASLTDAEIVECLISTLQKVDGCSHEEASTDPAIAAALQGYRAEQKTRKAAEALRGAEHPDDAVRTPSAGRARADV